MSDYQPRHDLDPVFYNGVQVNDLTWLSGGGVGCRITGISGWQDNIDVRDVRDPKPGQHGEDASNAYMGGRTITIQGEVDGSSFANLQSRLRTLATTFAPTTSEVVLKMPDPSQASPTTSYASEISGYERAYCKVVEAITFGEKTGPFNQSWQVVLRASDPRIYNDVTTTDDRTISSYAGTVATPLKIDTVLSAAGSTTGFLSASSPTQYGVASLYDPDGTQFWAATTPSFTTASKFVVDGGVDNASRGAYFVLPQSAARITTYDCAWHYRLNETAGTTLDNFEGTAALDATTSGSPTLNQTGPLTDTKSIAFDGVNDYFSRAYVSGLSPSEFTFEMWVKCTASGYPVSFQNAATTQGFQILMSTTSLQFFISSASASQQMIAYVDGLSGSTWYHVAMTYRSGSFSCYVNGVNVGTFVGTYYPVTSGTVYFGRDVAGSSYWTGNMSSVTMHSVGHSAQTISDLYNGGAATSICRYGAGRFISSIQNWPSLSGALTLSSYYALTNTSMVTTYRAARL